MATVPDKSGNGQTIPEPHYKTRNELLKEIEQNTSAP